MLSALYVCECEVAGLLNSAVMAALYIYQVKRLGNDDFSRSHTHNGTNYNFIASLMHLFKHPVIACERSLF